MTQSTDSFSRSISTLLQRLWKKRILSLTQTAEKQDAKSIPSPHEEEKPVEQRCELCGKTSDSRKHRPHYGFGEEDDCECDSYLYHHRFFPEKEPKERVRKMHEMFHD